MRRLLRHSLCLLLAASLTIPCAANFHALTGGQGTHVLPLPGEQALSAPMIEGFYTHSPVEFKIFKNLFPKLASRCPLGHLDSGRYRPLDSVRLVLVPITESGATLAIGIGVAEPLDLSPGVDVFRPFGESSIVANHQWKISDAYQDIHLLGMWEAGRGIDVGELTMQQMDTRQRLLSRQQALVTAKKVDL